MPRPFDPLRLQRKLLVREWLVVLGMVAVWSALVWRIWQLHSELGPELARAALNQHTASEPIAARPGDITDRDGRMLACSVAMQSLYVVPREIRDLPEFADHVADACGLDAAALEETLTQKSELGFLWVKRRLTEEESNRIRHMKLPTGTWGFRQEFRRIYPMGSLAAQTIGLRNLDGQGQGGIEEQYDALLRGADGERSIIQDARGRIMEIREDCSRPARDGSTVRLTLDMRIQTHVERALDTLCDKWHPQGACAAVLDPRTGELLALASRPTYDPNSPAGTPDAAWKNNLLCAMYEPGSTFKPFIVGWAVQEGCVQPDEIFHCEQGAYRMGRRLLHDHHPYGELSVIDILVKSSNIGMAKIGERLRNDRLHAAAVAFGFGSRTGIDLPGEVPGQLHPLKDWTSYSTGSIPMGQELATTPLQILQAFGTLANDGALVPTHLAMCDAGTETSRVPSRQVLKPEIARWLRTEALTAVVERGTGKKARIPGYRLFGKTGTAQKLEPNGTYSATRHFSSFVCGAPADSPTIVVIVSVDEPHGVSHRETYGGTVAAPTAGEIVLRTLQQLGVPMDPKVQVTREPDEGLEL